MIIFSFLAIVLTCSISSASSMKTEIDGNIDAQFRSANNQSDAETLGQNWSHENFSLLSTNTHAIFSLKNSKLEINWFNRYSQSDLYKKDFFATRLMNFPNQTVSRDVFRLSHKKQSQDALFESVLNQAFYEWDYDDSRFAFGRLFINYGQGEIFNPINPFNQPTGLTSQSNVGQGNDGFKVTIFSDPDTTWNFFLIGDKQVKGNDGSIDATTWLHGEFRLSDIWQIDYVLGRDQMRHKTGAQATYQSEESLLFSQVFYQTEIIDKNIPSTHLWDIMLGYDRRLTTDWHIRVEGGHQKTDQYLTIGNASQFNSRFLPSEYFVAVANEYQLHSLLKGSATVIHDFKSRFGYGLARLAYSFKESWEVDLFGFAPIYRNGNKIAPIQKLFTSDVGLSVRAFF
jgi:hypothetical protein